MQHGPRTFSWVGGLTALLLAACGGDAPDGGSQGVQDAGIQGAVAAAHEMLGLAKAEDWGAYVDRFYGEAAKFRTPADRDALVARFRGRWGEQVTAALERAVQQTPRLDGDQALFEAEDGPLLVLHRAADGRWTFHL